MLLALVALTALLLATTGRTARERDYVTNALLCIHSHEGSWQDAGAPYWGGLQMDMDFQSTYGYIMVHGYKLSFLKQWGTADHWPVWAQLQAGRNAVKVRGYYPWPNTARMCGLI